MRAPKIYYDELLQENFLFFIGWPISKTVAYLKRHWQFDETNLFGTDHAGKTFEFRDGGRRAIVIWTRLSTTNNNCFPTLAHECVHAANFALLRIGAHASFDNDETQAHLVGLLMRKSLGK